MATLYKNPTQKSKQTHVLVIGVGAYTHLTGGLLPAADTFGMGQLTSPQMSAAAMLKWFLNPLLGGNLPGFFSNSHPLGSVEGLIAAPSPVSIETPSGVMQLQTARAAEIRNAFDTWLARLQSKPQNTGILYFCGHGLSGRDDFILAQDFLVNPNRMFENSFNIDETFSGLQWEFPGGHLHLWLDACRVASEALLVRAIGGATNLLSPDFSKSASLISYSRIKSTLPGDEAFAMAGKISFFTDALLTALSGYCGTNVNGSWSLSGTDLCAAVKRLCDDAPKPNRWYRTPESLSGGKERPLIDLLSAPKAKVSLSLRPMKKSKGAELSMHSTASHGTIHKEVCKWGKCKLEVERGMYELHAASNSNLFPKTVVSDQLVVPPVFSHRFEV